ncbi:hypothetical protein CFC21_052610 [Triticum aestivum]|uniref:Uncharacterized protein n=4 Tax=Triticum TaxID=4564 RepID=A0A9R0W0W2_TRITD|nr:hypothetical protein TRIUR3_10882 [Triticum urartu]KAF7043220.1 hypothetical protein CFC21_052610 [Triticum aestivum]VAH92619.1 unnamed protein product [Triticum turgidum subsp. durum]
MALDMAYAKPSNVHQLKDQLRSCNCTKMNIKLTILAAEPFHGADEAVVELWRPAEAGILGTNIGAH